MSKNKSETFAAHWDSGYVITDRDVQSMEGRILTIVEALGLKDTQEKSAKDLVRVAIWKLLEPCFVISSDDHSLLRKKYHEQSMYTETSTPKNY